MTSGCLHAAVKDQGGMHARRVQDAPKLSVRLRAQVYKRLSNYKRARVQVAIIMILP